MSPALRQEMVSDLKIVYLRKAKQGSSALEFEGPGCYDFAEMLRDDTAVNG
jgi:hypothetical protein